MKMNTDRITGLFLTISLLLAVHPVLARQPVKFEINKPDYYKMGMKMAKQGKTKMALQIWLQAKARLEVPDTRIGASFIQLVTEKDLQKYYKVANWMYKWGLSAHSVEDNKKALQKMIARVGVLAEAETYSKWHEMIGNNNAAIYNELRQFWQKMDITPTSSYNERLIEHWQRIAYAQKHFNRYTDEPFHADARAKIYVRYGRPNRIAEELLSWKPTVASSFINRIASIPFHFEDPSSSAVQYLVDKVHDYYTYPRVTIWVYYPGDKHKDKLLFIFGESQMATGLIESVQDFIPASAFKTVAQSVTMKDFIKPLGQISPALILQIMYYRQLSNVAGYFGDIYTDAVNRAISSTAPVSVGLATLMAQQAWTEINKPKIEAPPQKSAITEKMVNIPIEVYSYRLLNKQNKPVVAIFMKSWPRTAFITDFAANYNKNVNKLSKTEIQNILKKYHYFNHLQLVGSDGELLTQVRTRPVIFTAQGSYSLSVFTVPVIGNDVSMVFSARLENRDSSSAYLVKKLPFPNELRGLGTVRAEQPVPLSNDKGKLQMGDLIVGYGYAPKASSDVQFPFTPAHNNIIPTGETIVVHVEVYHLQKKGGEFGNLSLKYQIKPEEGLLGFIDEDQDPLQLTLNIETSTTRYVQNIRINTRELPAGNYTFIMTAIDKKTGQKVQRKFLFELKEVAHKEKRKFIILNEKRMLIVS